VINGNEMTCGICLCISNGYIVLIFHQSIYFLAISEDWRNNKTAEVIYTIGILVITKRTELMTFSVCRKYYRQITLPAIEA